MQHPHQLQVRNCHVRFIRELVHRRVRYHHNVLTGAKRVRVHSPLTFPNFFPWGPHRIPNSNVESDSQIFVKYSQNLRRDTQLTKTTRSVTMFTFVIVNTLSLLYYINVTYLCVQDMKNIIRYITRVEKNLIKMFTYFQC